LIKKKKEKPGKVAKTNQTGRVIFSGMVKKAGRPFGSGKTGDQHPGGKGSVKESFYRSGEQKVPAPRGEKSTWEKPAKKKGQANSSRTEKCLWGERKGNVKW